MSDHGIEELLSAVLDGAASAADVERVNSDAELRNQLASLRATQAALVAPTPPDEAVRDRMIAAAIAEYAQLNNPPVDSSTPGTDTPPVSSLDEARRARARKSRRFNRVAMAAASVAVVVGGVTIVNNSSSNDSSDDSADTAADSFDTQAVEQDQGAESEMMASAAPSTNESFDRIEADSDAGDIAIGGGLTQDALDATAERAIDEEMPDDEMAGEDTAAEDPAEGETPFLLDPEVENALAPCRPALDEKFGSRSTFEADVPLDQRAWEFDVISPTGDRTKISLDLESCIAIPVDPQP
jgi:negative regulator of sigma E activity